MKQRIMSRKEIALIGLAKRNNQDIDREKFEQLTIDMLFYMIEDGNTVKIYHDTNMGGTVVEIVE